MGSNWLAVDSNFPSFTGRESPTEQIRALHNYLHCLKEHLKYSLNNLTADNWNTAALDSLTADAKEQLRVGIASMTNQLTQMQAQINDLQKKVAIGDKLDSRVTATEESITYLEEDVQVLAEQALQMQQDLSDHEQRLTDQETAMAAVMEQVAGIEAEIMSLDEELSSLLEALPALQETVSALEQIVSFNEDGSATIGKEGAVLHLVGQIYLNGVLLERGGTNETA